MTEVRSLSIFNKAITFMLCMLMTGNGFIILYNIINKIQNIKRWKSGYHYAVQ